MKKRFFYMVLIALFWEGCGVTRQGTPLGHHAKDLKQSDFDPSLPKWEIDNAQGLRISMNSKYIYLQFDHSAAPNNAQNIQFIIDIDNNTSTGNRTEHGADYIIENGYLYQAGASDLWDWSEQGKVEAAIEGTTDTVRIPLANLKNKNDVFCVNAELLDDQWKPVWYSPSQTDENGNHQKTCYQKAE